MGEGTGSCHKATKTSDVVQILSIRPILYHSVVYFSFGHLLVQTLSVLVFVGVALFVHNCHTVSYMSNKTELKYSGICETLPETASASGGYHNTYYYRLTAIAICTRS